jgi:hypothetical protein
LQVWLIEIVRVLCDPAIFFVSWDNKENISIGGDSNGLSDGKGGKGVRIHDQKRLRV